MRYFIALLCSPLALVLASRPGAAVLNTFLYVASFGGWLLFGVPGFILWGLSVLHAWIVISNAKAGRRLMRMKRIRKLFL